MSRRSLSAVVRYLQQLDHAQRGSGASDAELLERYVHHRDETAFELLLWRHGAMVHNVCRRMLPCREDAEDAFQATFLAFVRKASTIVRQGSVAAWLYKVAYRVALQARERVRKKALREKPGGEQLAVSPESDPLWEELRPILDEEVNRLPERLRQPFVLCYLEGKTNEEAARQLGCPAGTIFSRLARGREMLRTRLLRRGVTLSVAALTSVLAKHAVEAMPAASLMPTTVRNALLFAAGQTVGVSTQAAALAEGVLRTMFVTKIKVAAVMVLILGLFAAGGGVLTRHALTAVAQEDDAKKKPVVSLVLPTRGGLQRTQGFPGHVRAAAQQQVYPVVSGYVKRLAVDLGDRVKKGDVLVEIDAPLLEMEAKQARAALALEQKQVQAAKAQVDTAQAEVKVASDHIKALEVKLKSEEAYRSFREIQHKRYAELLASRAIDQRLVDEQEDRFIAAQQDVTATQQMIQSARSEVVVYESKVQSAKVALETATTKRDIASLAVEKAELQHNFAVLRANLDGVVIGRHINTGEVIVASDQGGRQPLLTVLRTDLVRVVVDAAENDVPFIHPGAAVHLQINALPDVELPAYKVSRTGFAIDEKTGTMPIEIDVPNPRNLLRPGLSMKASIHLDKKAPAGAVTVPASSVVRSKGHSYIYIVRDGEAHLTPIKVSWSSDDKKEIASGLHVSDAVVVDPSGLKGEIVAVEVKKTP